MTSNNYEAQISPVQMDKEGRNVLEVRFKYSAFKVFKVSVMAQKPIIKKKRKSTSLLWKVQKKVQN